MDFAASTHMLGGGTATAMYRKLLALSVLPCGVFALVVYREQTLEGKSLGDAVRSGLLGVAFVCVFVGVFVFADRGDKS